MMRGGGGRRAALAASEQCSGEEERRGRESIFKRTAQASAASDAGAAPGYHGTMLRTLCLLVLLLASSCFAATFYVNVTATAFVPQSLSIQEGDIVVWNWNNGAGWYASAFARTIVA